MDGSNQTVFVAADIEDRHRVSARHRRRISVWINAAHVLKIMPLRLSKKPKPFFECLGGVGMSLGKLAEALAGNDAHDAKNPVALPERILKCLHYVNSDAACQEIEPEVVARATLRGGT